MTDTSKDTYSQFVRYAKIGFPVLALILMVGVFVFSKTNPIRNPVIIPGPELAELAVGQTITNPHYSGVTKSGDAFTISAISALPNSPQPDQVDLVEPNTTIGFTSGLELHTTSDIGHLDLETQEATLTGSVHMETSDNYIANTKKIILNFYTGNANSPGPIEADGPIGHITAGNMDLTQDLHDKTYKDGAILRFGNGVKLVYYPKVASE
jgi:lipopolysaccharide export system protein LptC